MLVTNFPFPLLMPGFRVVCDLVNPHVVFIFLRAVNFRGDI